MSSSHDARREQPLAEETTKNIRAPRPPAQSGVVVRVPDAERDAPEPAPKPVAVTVTEIAPPPSLDPRRD